MEHRVELLAPAGNMEGFYGALHAGADAVYLGGERFGARAFADNFSAADLLGCIRYAHMSGRRVYLTVNTLLKETEREEFIDYMSALYEGGLDAAIVQDLGVFAMIREYFPDLKLHASTQMTITGEYGVRLLEEMGARRVVPARELSLAELARLKQTTGLEIEVFVHGAMCYCYSGQCLFSSMLGGRSGNRGRCAQPCRLPYRAECCGRAVEERYLLSLKDMCTVEHIPELIEAGIDSFKIEGRMKKPEYTAGVTAIYRKYIDRYYAGDTQVKVSSDDSKALDSLYIRSGRQDGYLFRQNGRDMVSMESPAYSGSDEALLDEIRRKYPGQKRKKGINICAVFKAGEPAEVVFSAECSGKTVQGKAFGEKVSGALKHPVTADNIKQQLGRLGATSFFAGNFTISLDDNIFYPLKAINELRREAVARLEDALIAENGFQVCRTAHSGAKKPENVQKRALDAVSKKSREKASDSACGNRHWHVALQSREQLTAVSEYINAESGTSPRIPERIYVEADLFAEAAEKGDGTFAAQCAGLREAGCELALALPYIIRIRDTTWLDWLWGIYEEQEGLFSGFLVRSMEGLGFLRSRRKSFYIYGDAGLYVWNSAAMRSLSHVAGEFGLDGFCMPFELNAGEQYRLLEGSNLPCEKVVYGRIPLMVTANCVVNTLFGCRMSGGRTAVRLTDRLNKRFPVICDCSHCMNIIYNSVPLSLHGLMAGWQGRVAFRLNFTLENGRETSETLRYFMSGAAEMPPYGEYTTGHEKRGAE